jgi:hypothetical protein
VPNPHPHTIILPDKIAEPVTALPKRDEHVAQVRIVDVLNALAEVGMVEQLPRRLADTMGRSSGRRRIVNLDELAQSHSVCEGGWEPV